MERWAFGPRMERILSLPLAFPLTQGGTFYKNKKGRIQTQVRPAPKPIHHRHNYTWYRNALVPSQEDTPQNDSSDCSNLIGSWVIGLCLFFYIVSKKQSSNKTKVESK